jgi:hypothetical protein
MVRRSIAYLWIPVILIMLSLWGCDPNQDSPDYATISGRIFSDSTMTQGVRDVAVVVESDIESQIPYSGPDQFAWTDSDGCFSVSFYLGHENESTGEITHTYIADCAVSYWYHGHFFAWDGGVTVASGKVYTLPNIHLGQFE